ncbi:hypothetical protein MQE36_04185 [Zhouia spongiae]|uniref:DUF4595 domain-containing protein n=1 Tax=Zhouia spongiae TaxID=2202721 RepID=A0ABY3YPB5_9FLAO|nr:hypothetical protein [Zhouia spongiae]UNY99548.1 hypothetical protein MQE36_04185 [Zhouia spongiae]
MKKMNALMPGLFVSVFLISCSDSTSDEFDEANGGVEEKLITQLDLASVQDETENSSVYLTYDADLRLSKASNGMESSTFVYEDDELSDVTGGNSGSVFNIEELYQSPYGAFETGKVLEYDDNKNPSLIEFYEEEYDYENDTYTDLVYTAEVSYDEAPSPYFFTLKAAGVIDVLDKVQLNFSASPESAEILKAKALFPVNNISKILYKDEKGNPVYEIKADYVYDDDNYPVSATISAKDLGNNETLVYTLNYKYMQK